MRPHKSVVRVEPPLGGTVNSTSFQLQPPFTAYDSENYWPIDYTTLRQAFAPAQPFAQDLLPGSGVVNMLADVNGVSAGNPQRTMIAGQNTNLYYWDGSAWQLATSGTGVLDASVPLDTATFLQQVIIADPAGDPILFDYPTTTASTLTASAGTIPTGLTIFAVWQGALWAAGATTTPQVLYATRVGDVTDWDFGAAAADKGAAFFTAGDDEGLLRGNITAIIPHTSDTMLVSTVEGIMALYQHPRQGGIIEDFSDHVVVGPMAWCKGPDDTTYIMTQQGLAAIPVADGARPALISYSKLPAEMQYPIEDPQAPQVTLAYDIKYNAVHINRRGDTEGWYFDLNKGGFFKQTQRLSTQDIWTALENPPFSLTANSSPLFGTNTECLRYGGVTPLIGQNMTTSLTVGPLKISRSMLERSKIVSGKIAWGDGGTPTSIDTATVSVAVGATGSEAISNLAVDAYKYIESSSLANDPQRISTNLFYPNLAGHAMALKIDQTLSFTSPSIFPFEGAEFSLKPLGANR